jgi:hypothetical protein
MYLGLSRNKWKRQFFIAMSFTIHTIRAPFICESRMSFHTSVNDVRRILFHELCMTALSSRAQ